jgi:dihydrofolate reductase
VKVVDEYHLFVTPVVVRGGKQFLPDGLRRRATRSASAAGRSLTDRYCPPL